MPDLSPGAWNVLDVSVHGDTYSVRINGVRTTEFVNLDEARGQSSAENPASGYVGVQAHSGRVAFRNIRVKPLPATAVINTPVRAQPAIAEPAGGVNSAEPAPRRWIPNRPSHC